MIERDGYRVRIADPARARDLGRGLGLGATTAQVLLHRGIERAEEAREFLAPTLRGLSNPRGMRGREEAADRLAHAARRGERVAIFGDYDVDGTTSAAILADVLEVLGARVYPFIANRFQGGYGFSAQALAACLEVSPDVIITCDCGSSDHPRIAAAKEAGVDVVVVDHHLVPEEELPALAFLNPHQPGCDFPFKGMCSAGLAFSVAAGVRASLGADLDLRPWLDLVALGTVADVMPLEGDNRRLVRAGLKALSAANPRPGVGALREVAKIRPGTQLGAQDIAFRLAPRLNAAGRLGDPTITLELLRSKTSEEARMRAARIEQINDERKAIERRVTEEAIASVLEHYGEEPSAGVVVASRSWHRGVVGITAARLVDRFGVPAVVVGIDDSGMGHGSGRTPEGQNLHAAFTECAELLAKFGGHAMAAGLSVREERVLELREAFAGVTPRQEGLARLPVVDVEIGREFGLPSVSELRALEPLGEGNPAPVFALDARVLGSRAVGGGQHLKVELGVGDTRVGAFLPNQGERAGTLPGRVVALGRLSPDHYRGGEALEINVDELLPR